MDLMNLDRVMFSPEGEGGGGGGGGAPAGAAPPAGGAAPGPTGGGAPGTSEPGASSAPRLPWKTKTRIGEEEHEVEIDVDPFLRSHRRKVKVDGEEQEVAVEDAYRAYERRSSSTKRYEQAQAIKREAEQTKAQYERQAAALEKALQDPAKAVKVLRRTLGEQGWAQMIADEVAESIRIEKMSPEERRAYADDRKRRDEFETERQKLDREKAELARERQEIEQAATQRQIAKFKKTWQPLMEKAGLPATDFGYELVAKELRRARKAGAQITADDAIEAAIEQYNKIVGPEAEKRRKRELEAVDQQPGRADLDAAPPPPPPPSQQRRARRQTLEDVQREIREQDRRRSVAR